MTDAGVKEGVTASKEADFGALSEEQRQALGALLDVSLRLAYMSRAIVVETDFRALVQGYAERVAQDACQLAGVPLGVVDPPGGEFAIVEVTLEGAGADWSAHVRSRREKAIAHYGGGPSRECAFACGLVLLARTLLDRSPEWRSPTCGRCSRVATCIEVVDDEEHEPVHHCDDCCAHDDAGDGQGFRHVHCEPVTKQVPSREYELGELLERAMSEFDDRLELPDPPPFFVPEGFHRWAEGCDPAKRNPAGICNCPGPGTFPGGSGLGLDEPSFHGSGGVE